LKNKNKKLVPIEERPLEKEVMGPDELEEKKRRFLYIPHAGFEWSTHGSFNTSLKCGAYQSARSSFFYFSLPTPIILSFLSPTT
jgi:hypothetical protein